MGNRERRWTRSVVIGFGGLLAWLGCNGRPVDDDSVPAEVREYVQQRCVRLEQCGCATASYEDRAACEARLVEIYEQEVVGREGIDLGCFSQGAELWRTSDCDDPHDDAPCNAVARQDGVGAACRVNPFRDGYVHVNPCAEGLACVEEQCIEAVDGALGEACIADEQCTRELTCVGARCEQPRGEGEACEESSNCEPGEALYCGEGICAPRKGTGDACASRSECRTGVPCVEGACAPYDPFLCFAAVVQGSSRWR